MSGPLSSLLEPSDGDEAEAEANAAISVCFHILDEYWRTEPAHIPLEASTFLKDRASLPGYFIDEWAWSLFIVAHDHMNLLRRIGGPPPDGREEWHAHAPWTLMRAALEAVSTMIWLVSPHDQDERLQRLLRLVHEDLDEARKAGRLNYRPRQRANIADFKQALDAFNVAAKRYPHEKAQERMRARINAVDCIRESARKSGVATEDAADQLWRVASGYAHARRWASLSTGEYIFERAVDNTRVYRGAIDMKVAARIVLLVTALMQYAEWLYATRAGYDRQKPKLVAQRSRPTQS